MKNHAKSKILFITRSSQEGGEAVFINKLKSALDADFWIVVCSLLGDRRDSADTTIYLQPMYFFEKPLVTLKSIRVLIEEIKKVDIVEHFVFGIYSFLFFLIAQWYSKIVVVTFHTQLDSRKSIRYPYDLILKLFITNYVTLFADKIIFLTNAQLDGYRKYCILKNKFNAKTVVIGNFIDQSTIVKSNVNDLINILFVGRYTKAKGFPDLLSVAELLPDISFTLIGDSSFVSPSTHVRNLGKLSYLETLDEYDKCSVLLIPSYTEVFPMVVLEAMARGLVILATDIPGMSEIIIDGRNGFLFDPGNVSQVKELILALKSNSKDIQRISKNNIDDVREYITEKQVPEYMKVYSSLQC